MAILKCIECNSKVSSEATACPHCGYVKGARPAPEEPITQQPINTSQPKPTQKASPLLIIGACVGGFLLLIILIGAVAGSQSTCKITSLKNSADTFYVNGQWDYGIITDAVVRLDGKARQVTVTVRLETNQGDITKAKRVAVSDNGSRQIQIQFIEPTVTTQVRQSYATCE